MDLDFSDPLVIGGAVFVGFLVIFGVLSLVRAFKKYRGTFMVALLFGFAVGAVSVWELKPPDDCPVLMPESPIVPPPEEKFPEANPNSTETLQKPDPPQ